MARNLGYAFGNDMPTVSLRFVEKTYGAGTGVEWLRLQLAFHFIQLGVQKGTDELTQMAATLGTAFQHVHCVVFMVFLLYLRAGRAGETYGRHDSETYGRLLDKFMLWVEDNRRQFEREYREYIAKLRETHPELFAN